LRGIRQGPGGHAEAHVPRDARARARALRKDDPRRRRPAVAPAQRVDAAHQSARGGGKHGRRAMRLGFAGGLLAVIAVILLIVGYSSLFQVYQTRQALVIRLGNPLRVVTQSGLHVKMPLLDTVIYVDKRILDLENSSQEV